MCRFGGHMPQDKIKKIHSAYGWVSAALIVAVGIALILSCLEIYSSGDRPFSRAVISQHFDQIAVLVYLCLASILGGVVLSLVFPLEKHRTIAVRDEAETLRRLRARVGAVPEAAKEAHLRCIYRCTAALIVIGAAIYPLFYFLDPGNFTIASLNQDVVRAVVIVLVTAIISLMTMYICSLLEHKSILREIDICKKHISKNPGNVPVTAKGISGKWLLVSRCLIFAAAVCFIVLGIFNEGIADVLGKAIRICTECIGLG